jgi:hypothetical protein
MKIKKEHNSTRARELWFCVFVFFLLGYLSQSDCLAVTSKVTRQSSSEDFLKGRTNDIVVGSEGILQLGRAAEVIVEKFEAANATIKVSEPWSINSIVVSGGTVYLGTSPNGGIYRYSLGKLTKIYPPESEERENAKPAANEPNESTMVSGEVVEEQQYLTNKHVFAMALDMTGRLLAGVSGAKCALYRFDTDKIKEPEALFEPNDAKYIFAIAVDAAGNIYLGTGPEGKVYKLNSFGKEPQLIYTSRDKNILSLAIGKDGFVYAGSDGHGLIYKINPSDKTATVLYDSDQTEITSLIFAPDGNLYAAATSAVMAQPASEFTVQPPSAGHPEVEVELQENVPENQGGAVTEGTDEGEVKLEIANTKEDINNRPPQREMFALKPSKPAEASYVYRITKDGYVTDIFTETAVFYCLAEQEHKLLIGTGGEGRTFTVDPASEQHAVIYKDEHASQIAAMAVTDDSVYLGTANPARLIKLAKTFAPEGTYTSDLVDAGQPADWGKLQIDADIPQGCKVMMSCRSGNVDDVNDPTFSDWTAPAEINGPVQMKCPVGRFSQYRLVLQTEDGRKSPIVREVAVADTVPNLAPRVESVIATRLSSLKSEEAESSKKPGIFRIRYRTKDDNDDKLIYKIDFRKVGREIWIELEKDLETDTYDWDSRTVEDGRYEIRVTASDERSNTPTTKLTGSRITEPFVVDNTGPVITKYSIESDKNTITLKMHASDQLSAIGSLEYTLDSNADWISTIPDDLVYDTTDEDFTIVIEQVSAGEHVVAIRVSDDVGNTTYKSFDVTVTSDGKGLKEKASNRTKEKTHKRARG